ncbi:hypothetical protein HAX54_035761 [Datura stramonium]|uniref:Uncharacterized protein n=1 Tax=Datura stramonium TaxID=4076 RepID=A0ABS8VHA0_DATST|nr:hypothetical protein [Datura stramonium]
MMSAEPTSLILSFSVPVLLLIKLKGQHLKMEGCLAFRTAPFAHAGIYGGANADISCSIPQIQDGRGPINPKGLQYYNNLIDELLSHGIPATCCYVTVIYHKHFKMNMGGWTSRKIINDFTAYADTLFHGNSSTEPYIVAHNILLAHSAAVRLYRRKYKYTQHGFVGLNLFAYRPHFIYK